MHTASFRFYASLNDFLRPGEAHQRFRYTFWGQPAIKDAIEAIGPPHTEVDLVLVNGRSVGFDHALRDGDVVTVYPVFSWLDITPITLVKPPSLMAPNFILDTHLGRLASYLRMLGFDCLYRNDYADDQLAQLSAREGRVLLTRDRGLLKRSEVQHGYCLRSRQPRLQLIEILVRFQLVDSIAPFTRCMRCNRVLDEARADELRSRIPARVYQSHQDFRQCPNCRRLFWKGSHHARMRALIDEVIGEVRAGTGGVER